MWEDYVELMVINSCLVKAVGVINAEMRPHPRTTTSKNIEFKSPKRKLL